MLKILKNYYVLEEKFCLLRMIFFINIKVLKFFNTVFISLLLTLHFIIGVSSFNTLFSLTRTIREKLFFDHG